MNMNEISIQELEEKYNELSKQCKDMGSLLKQKKQEEEDKRKAELEKEKDSRYKEIEDASKHLSQLITDYTKDYGSFSFKRGCGNDNHPISYLLNKFFF